MDTKIISFLSTAAGITPCKPLERFISQKEGFGSTLFPNAFDLYNRIMFGVDLYDQHCSDICIRKRRRKWTWAIFLRLIESSISNALVLWNLCAEADHKKELMILLS